MTGRGETYDAHAAGAAADGMVISGPRVDDERCSTWSATGSRSSSGFAARCRRGQCRRRQHRGCPGCGRAPDRARSPAHRVHHERAARLHRRAGPARGYRGGACGAGLTIDEALIAEAAFDAQSGHATMARSPRADDLRCGVRGQRRRRPRCHRRPARSGLRIPDDVSIVGFDDIPLAAYFDPPLTTVRLPAFELGHAAGRALLDRIADRAVPARTLLPTELIVRASTAPSSTASASGAA